MTRSKMWAVKVPIAALVVFTLWRVHGGHYALPVDLVVYAVSALAVFALVDRVASAGRREDPDPADRADVQTREEALREAADWAITGRPESDPPARTVTAAMVQREAFMRSGLEVTEEEARAVLGDRLRFRGYA